MLQNIIRLLLVEDNPGDAQLLTEELLSLPSQYFEITHVESFSEALKRLRLPAYDIVFLDLNLPDSFGLETLERFQGQPHHLPVIVLTGTNDEELGITAVQLGAADYLVKGQADGRLLKRSIFYSIERHLRL